MAQLAVWKLPEHERPIDAATIWTRYFVVLMFIVLAAWGLSDFSGATQGWLTLLLLAVVAMRVVSRHRQERRLRALRQSGLEALRAGNILRAGTVLDAALGQVHRYPMLHAIVLADRALVDMRQGMFETAKGRLWAALDSGWIPDEGDDALLQGLILLRYAECEALEGRLESAEQWRVRAGELLGGQGDERMLTVRFIIAAREGRLEDALALAEGGWDDAQLELSKDQLRILGILIAFGRERSGFDPGEADPWFALLAPGEADFLGRSWPEMRDFLRRHRHATLIGLGLADSKGQPEEDPPDDGSWGEDELREDAPDPPDPESPEPGPSEAAGDDDGD
jgi:hypothetical protein